MSEESNQFVFHKHDQLKHGVDKWVKIFNNLEIKKNPKIGIIHEINFEYICILFAAIKIGANFIILDSRFDDMSTHKPFMPLDILVYDYCIDILCDDLEYWKINADNLVDAGQIEKTKIRETANSEILNLDFDFDLHDSKILSSTTSGTTGPAKIIDHSYQYILEIACRNAQVLNFNGRVAHIKNLYHGSSLPVFYLPSMIASDFHFCVPWLNDQNDQNLINHYVEHVLINTEILNINHILFPHKFMIDNFLEAVSKFNLIFDNLKIYTLSYIDLKYKELIKDRNIEIVSIFGCTETSGPILINSLSKSNFDTFDPSIFRTLDDFFELTILHNGTRVRSKNGYVDHVMNDLFEKIDDCHYRHLGRSDLYRINDMVLDLKNINDIKDRLCIDGDIIIDSQLQSIYIALWDDSDAVEICNAANRELHNTFGTNKLTISKCLNLNKFDYITGIKVNLEKAKQFFRSIGDSNV